MSIIADETLKHGCRDRVITIDVDIVGVAVGLGGAWPPPFLFGTLGDALATLLKIEAGGTFLAINVLLSFRTVVLPRSFDIQSATLKLRLTGNQLDPEGRSVSCDQFFWGETVEAADYSAGSFPGLDGLVPIDDAIPLVGSDLEFAVRPSSVLRRRNDPSQFRLTITGGEPAPATDSRITFIGDVPDRSIVPRLECRLRGCRDLSEIATEE